MQALCYCCIYFENLRGFLPEHRIHGTVLPHHVVDGGHGCHQGDLSQETAYAQGQEATRQPDVRPEAVPIQAHRPGVEQVPHREDGGDDLPDDSGYSGAHHAPLEDEDEQGVKDDVQHRTGQGGGHGELRASVGADDGVHGLSEHVEGDAQGDPEEVLLGALHGALVDVAAEGVENRVGGQQVHGGQQGAGYDTDQDGIAHTAVSLLLVVPAQADADKGAGSVADHHGDGQGDDS